MRTRIWVICLTVLGSLTGFISFQPAVHAQNRNTGEIRFITASKEMKATGVWIDGEYVGFVDELKGFRTVRLQPGNHEVVLRQAGYVDLTRNILVNSKMVTDVDVKMDPDRQVSYPDPKTSSEVRLDIQPARAAVIVDDQFMGTVDQFYGVNHAMILAPGKHRIKVVLPGYRTFETDLELSPHQKVGLKTELIAGSASDAGNTMQSESPRATSPAEPSTPAAAR